MTLEEMEKSFAWLREIYGLKGDEPVLIDTGKGPMPMILSVKAMQVNNRSYVILAQSGYSENFNVRKVGEPL